MTTNLLKMTLCIPLSLAVVLACGPLLACGENWNDGKQGYYMQPTLHGNLIAFVAEGDVGLVEVEGGLARRLTTHPGIESTPRFSPDGRTVAFAAQ